MTINACIYILQHELKFSTVTSPMGLISRFRLKWSHKHEFLHALWGIYWLRIFCERYNVCRKLTTMFGCSDNYLLEGWQPGSQCFMSFFVTWPQSSWCCYSVTTSDHIHNTSFNILIKVVRVKAQLHSLNCFVTHSE
jgi:hypothetical protein